MAAKGLLGATVKLVPMLLLLGCGGAGEGRLNQAAAPAREPPGQTLHVAPSADCVTVEPCYASVQEALDAASDGDLIKVAAGAYTTTAPQVARIEKDVHLIGGYHPQDWSRSDPGTNVTVLDAEAVPGRRGVAIDGPMATPIKLAGFRIQRGYAQGSDGGGIHIAGGSVVLEDNTVTKGAADGCGGGVFVSDGQVTMRRNRMEANAAAYGGGLCVAGGSVSVEGDVLMGNEARPSGGAIAVSGGSLSGANVTVAGNPLAGAGVYLTGGEVTGIHWTLADNGQYGAVATLGVETDRGSAGFVNTIVASHRRGFFGSGVVAHRTLFHDVDNPCMAGASCVSNLFGDPQFLDPAQGDYRIGPDSAAINQGYGTEVVTDTEGGPRPVGAAPDLGAHEARPGEMVADESVAATPGDRRVYLPLVLRRAVAAGP